MVKGDYGKERVIAEIQRVDLDGCFERSWPALSGAERRTLVEGNSDIVAEHTQKKYAAGDWSDEARFGSTVKRIEITRADLFGGPRLTDARLAMEKAAGLKQMYR
jgi:hypothetical protein